MGKIPETHRPSHCPFFRTQHFNCTMTILIVDYKYPWSFTNVSRVVKFMIMVVDYFTKWIEEETLTKITTTNIHKIFKNNVLARYMTPQSIIIYNDTQLTYKNLKKIFQDLKVKNHLTLVEHLQTNGQVEVANIVLLRKLKRILELSKRNWVEELPHFLW